RFQPARQPTTKDGSDRFSRGDCPASQHFNPKKERDSLLMLSLRRTFLHYQTNLALTWPMRGSRALVMFPKLPLLISPLGFMNCAWLKMLKNSPRISNNLLSVTGIVFVIPKSVLLKPGPWKNRR